MNILNRMMKTGPDKAVILIRIAVGIVFLSEGIQKFLYPASRGAGRFEKIGLSAPETLGYLVGGFETLCGALVLVGFLTRFASIPLIVIMIFALSLTKIDILMDEGIWEMLHESRTDMSMLLGSVFLLIKGGGCWSADHTLLSRR